jgi:hypothetical protein
MSDSEELPSSNEGSSSTCETRATERMFGPRVALARKAMRFTAAQRALMNAYYSQGMVGTGKKHRRLIKKAANDAELSTPQIKVSRYKLVIHFLTACCC